MAINLGERVSKDKEVVERLGREWKVTADVYYAGSHYNIYCLMEEQNLSLFSAPDSYSKTVRADDKEEIEDEVERGIEMLFEAAEKREEARDVSIDVSID